MKYCYAFIMMILMSFVQAGDDKTKITLLTEDYPPFNMQLKNGKVGGLSTDIVQEMFRRTQFSYTIALEPWVRAYNSAILDKNTCVYSTTRTENREQQFKWVGPLVENPWVLYVRPDGPKIYSLEDARRYKIGGYQGDAISQYLIARGFNVELVIRDELNIRKLETKRIDFWATGKYSGIYLLKREKAKAQKPILVFNTMFMFLACNPNMSNQIIYKLNEALHEMQNDGFIERAGKSYLKE